MWEGSPYLELLGHSHPGAPYRGLESSVEPQKRALVLDGRGFRTRVEIGISRLAQTVGADLGGSVKGENTEAQDRLTIRIRGPSSLLQVPGTVRGSRAQRKHFCDSEVPRQDDKCPVQYVTHRTMTGGWKALTLSQLALRGQEGVFRWKGEGKGNPTCVQTMLTSAHHLLPTPSFPGFSQVATEERAAGLGWLHPLSGVPNAKLGNRAGTSQNRRLFLNPNGACFFPGPGVHPLSFVRSCRGPVFPSTSTPQALTGAI